MSTVSMFETQQSSDDLWHLAPGEAMSFAAGPGARMLSVTQGRLWLTFDGVADTPAEDIWLQPGDVLALRSGQRLVAEGSGATSFRLSVPPCRRRARDVGVRRTGRMGAWLAELGLRAA